MFLLPMALLPKPKSMLVLIIAAALPSSAMANDDLQALVEQLDPASMSQSAIDLATDLANTIPGLPPEYIEPWSAAAAVAYSPEAVEMLMIDIYAKLDPAELDEVLAYLRTEQGAKLLPEETSEVQEDFNAVLETLSTFQTDHPVRFELYEDLLNAQFSDRFLAETRPLLIALIEPAIGEAEAAAYADLVAPVVSEAVTASAMMRYITFHEERSDADIENILAFSQSPAGQAFFAAGHEVEAAIFTVGLDTLKQQFAAGL